jgi:hypothetical protein
VSAFTPGPWKVAEREVLEDGSVYPTHIVAEPTEHEVCHLESQCAAQEGWEIHPTRAANHRLIAAAPDLAHALRRYVARDEAEGRSSECDNSTYRDALAALAKATGSQP